jgi:hypothetical protein
MYFRMLCPALTFTIFYNRPGWARQGFFVLVSNRNPRIIASENRLAENLGRKVLLRAQECETH